MYLSSKLIYLTLFPSSLFALSYSEHYLLRALVLHLFSVYLPFCIGSAGGPIFFIFMQFLAKVIYTRMHSSRMRTDRSLTVCCSLLPRGGLVWGVPGLGGMPGLGGVCSRGRVPGLGGVWSGGWCLVQGGVCSQGGVVPGWGGYPSMH